MKKTTALLYFLFVISNCFGQTAEEWKKKGKEKLDAKEYAAAVNYLGKSILIDTNDTESYLYRSEANMYLEKYNEALIDVNKVLFRDKHSPIANYRMGRIKYIYEDYKVAIEYFNKCIEVGLYVPKSFYWRGLSKVMIGDSIGSVDDYNKAIEITPSDFDSYYFRGRTFVALNKFKEAITEFDKSIELKPKEAFL